jgi:hypothetical protein
MYFESKVVYSRWVVQYMADGKFKREYIRLGPEEQERNCQTPCQAGDTKNLGVPNRRTTQA